MPCQNVDDILTFISASNYFTSLDMKSSYHQIPVRAEDQEKTAFVTTDSLYHWLRLPFGLKTAGATYNRAMFFIFKDMINKEILVYLDDILIFSKTFDQHLQTLRKVIRRLSDHRFKLNPIKCLFSLREITYLGYTINKFGFAPDPEKIKAVVEFPVPKNVKDVQAFIGLTSFYRKFIQNFSRIAKPLSLLTKLLAA